MKYAVAADRKANMEEVVNGLFETEATETEITGSLAKAIRITGAICLGIYMGVVLSGVYNAVIH